MRLWKKRYGAVRFHFIDIVCMSYLLLISVLLLFFHRNIPGWPKYIAIHIGVVFVVLELVRWGEKNRDYKTVRFIRTFYPIAINFFAWRELDALIPMFFDDYWATDVIISMEKSVFGALPNVWVQQFYTPWLDELMNVLYSGYYILMPVVGMTLFFRKKYEAAIAVYSIGIFTHFVNFLIFFFVPVLAPFMAEGAKDWNIGSWTGYFFADLTRLIQSSGSCRGATFPSSHVSAAFVWAFIALRYLRPMGYVLLPMAFGIAISTVYLGYHYAVDPIFAVILALICFPAALRIIKSRNEDPLTDGRGDDAV